MYTSTCMRRSPSEHLLAVFSLRVLLSGATFFMQLLCKHAILVSEPLCLTLALTVLQLKTELNATECHDFLYLKYLK